jgi:hypothetical protein
MAMLRARAVSIWFSLMALGGFGFGLVAERRPLGDDVLAHPFALYFITVGAALLVLRVAAARPVPELLSERVLLLGCLVGALAFLAGNWFGTHVLLLAGV